MDLQLTTETFGSDDQTWLGSATGAGDAYSGTIDASVLTPATHYPDGYIPSGCILGKITASGLYGPYDPVETDGRETAVGVLLDKVPMRGNDAGCNIMWHGRIIEANLPFSGVTGEIDAAGKVDLGDRFVWA